MLPIRLLHVTMLAAALLLFVQLGSIWDGLRPLGQNIALAAGDERKSADDAAHEADASHDADADGLSDADTDADGFPEEFTLEEIEVLQDLSERRTALEQRESELSLREGLLNVAEQRIEAKISDMQELRGQIESLLRQYDEQEEAELLSLVKIYETMKPKDAARILQDLEMDVLMAILERMKERSTAPIMAAMNAPTAREVTTELARRRELDLPNG